MSEFGLGNKEEAHRLLNKADQQIEESLGPNSEKGADLTWRERIELQWFRREAENLMGSALGAKNLSGPPNTGAPVTPER